MGNGDIFKTMQDCIASGQKIPRATLDQFLLTGMVELYNKQAKYQETIDEKFEKLRPAMTTYKVLVWVVSGMATVIIGALLTGKMQLTIVP